MGNIHGYMRLNSLPPLQFLLKKFIMYSNYPQEKGDQRYGKRGNKRKTGYRTGSAG